MFLFVHVVITDQWNSATGLHKILIAVIYSRVSLVAMTSEYSVNYEGYL